MEEYGCMLPSGYHVVNLFIVHIALKSQLKNAHSAWTMATKVSCHSLCATYYCRHHHSLSPSSSPFHSIIIRLQYCCSNSFYSIQFGAVVIEIGIFSKLLIDYAFNTADSYFVCLSILISISSFCCFCFGIVFVSICFFIFIVIIIAFHAQKTEKRSRK